MPSALKIYRIDASPYWQVRLFVEGRLKRKSTRCTDRREAIAFAKQFYDSIRIAQRRRCSHVTELAVNLVVRVSSTRSKSSERAEHKQPEPTPPWISASGPSVTPRIRIRNHNAVYYRNFGGSAPLL